MNWRISRMSFRTRVPLTIMVVILLTEAVVAVTLVSRANAEARRDLESSAANLATVLARSLREPMLRDDLWSAFEVVRTPVASRSTDNLLQDVVVLDVQRRVFVASDPDRFPVANGFDSLPGEFAASVMRVTRDVPFDFRFPTRNTDAEIVASGRIVADDGTLLGSVVLSFDSARFYRRLNDSLLQLGLISIPGLVGMMVIGGLWGNRLTRPMTALADAMRRVGRDPPRQVADALPRRYPADEVAALTEAFTTMLGQLERNAELEREVVSAERLAAVGRVAAGIAHEINNPLGGMLNAIDTLSTHGNPDAFTNKTLGLLHRGLTQIRTTVGALLVEARLDSPAVVAADWEDLRTLVHPEVTARAVHLSWNVEFDQAVALPAQQVRQLVLNLLLNAIKAAGADGEVSMRASLTGTHLQIQVANSGQTIPPESLAELFEPFAQTSIKDGRRSYGIGLWICYQIINQLDGSIIVTSENHITLFVVSLPLVIAKASNCEPLAESV